MRGGERVYSINTPYHIKVIKSNGCEKCAWVYEGYGSDG